MEQTDKLNNHVYDDDSIVTLEDLEHIRLRPGMYIGRPEMAPSPTTACMC